MSEFVWICYELLDGSLKTVKVVNNEDKAFEWCNEQYTEKGMKEITPLRGYHVWRVE